jgi:outer membrane protein insertion porin family
MKATTMIILCGCALRRCLALVSAVLISLAGGLGAQDFEGKKIAGLEIRYVGAKTVNEERIRNLVSSKAGTTYSAEKLDADVRELMKSGLVDDIRFLAEEVNGQIKLVAEVATRVEYVALQFLGNTLYSDQELAKATKLSSRGVLSDDKILVARLNLEDYYHERGYPDTTVMHRVQPSAAAGKAELLFVIDEGAKNEIRKIRFEGNHAFPDQELRKEVKTKENGPLLSEQLDQDLDAVLDYYRSNGYLRVNCPGTRREQVADGLVDIVIPIDEGGKYTVASVSFGELTALKPEELHPAISLNAKDVYSSQKMRADITMIRSRYCSRGYADVMISPDIRDAGPNQVTITYLIDEGARYRVGRVNISGNTKTADQVIRREIPLKPGDWFNPVELEAAKARLSSLGLFSEVNISGSESESGFRDVDVLVEE